VRLQKEPKRPAALIGEHLVPQRCLLFLEQLDRGANVGEPVNRMAS
jgi:hypothetical protein